MFVTQLHGSDTVFIDFYEFIEVCFFSRERERLGCATSAQLILFLLPDDDPKEKVGERTKNSVHMTQHSRSLFPVKQHCRSYPKFVIEKDISSTRLRIN